MFFAIATLVDSSIWERILEKNPSVKELILSHPGNQEFIHFSWVVSEEMDKDKTISSLGNAAKLIQPFTVKSGGLGIFPGVVPAVTYILARNRMLDQAHSLIWNTCTKHLGSLKMTYSSENWIPHITLLHHGLESGDYCEFLEKSIENDFSFSIQVNNLAIIYKDETSAGLLYKCDLR
jgi:2'-5' RNA ligase